MVLPQAMAWVQYWFRVLSLKFCGKFKKKLRRYISTISRFLHVWVSVPKWKRGCSQLGLLFQEIFNIKKLLVGWASFFSFWYWKWGGTVKKTPCIYFIILTTNLWDLMNLAHTWKGSVERKLQMYYKLWDCVNPQCDIKMPGGKQTPKDLNLNPTFQEQIESND